MSTRKILENMDRIVDLILLDEKKTSKFATKKLRKYTHETLYDSYTKTRDDLGLNLGEGVVGLALFGIGQKLSIDSLADPIMEKYDKSSNLQKELDERWLNLESKIESLYIPDLLHLLAIYRKNDFAAVLDFLQKI